MSYVPLWVIVRNVPLRLCSWEGLSVLTSPLGVPKDLHPETKDCKNFEKAKILMDVDLTKSLPSSFTFDSGQGENITVGYSFPRLPPRCGEFSQWSHVTTSYYTGARKGKNHYSNGFIHRGFGS